MTLNPEALERPTDARCSGREQMTHEDLRKRAVKWLTNTKHCGVVLSEIVTALSEIPDAVGWQSWASFLVECKVSRADFRAQQDKPWMRSGRGVGQFRYFMVPSGLIGPADLEDQEWGLLCVDDCRIRVVKEAARREPNREDEIRMLVSALRRVRAREFLILVSESDIEAQGVSK
jgi:hypothetical protein